jgi:O-antigen/teichoic acid export membrane protein
MTEIPFPPQPTGIFARALAGSVLTAGSFVLTQALRLASNLILTRLLFPEAFGVMALVSVVLVGLAMFSNVGIGPAISQHPKGADPEFLDTAFSINVARGALLWGLTCLLAWPMAQLYGVPDLALLLPAAGLTLMISGFHPTRIDTANRPLLLGRVTVLDLTAQVLGIAAIVVLALLLLSVWALVLGAIIGALAKLILMSRFLPGRANRFFWQREAGRDLIYFGKWIFLSTACGFALSQGDKAILGAYLPLDQLGIYNIGYFFAAFPVLLAGAVTGRIMIPIYRDRHPSASPQNAAHLRRLRLVFTAGVLALLACVGSYAAPIVGLLYDPRYAADAPIIAALAMAQMPMVIGMTYDQSALAAGNSKGLFPRDGAARRNPAAGLSCRRPFRRPDGRARGPRAGRIGHAYAAHPPRADPQGWDAAHDTGFFLTAAALTGLIAWENGFLFGGLSLN